MDRIIKILKGFLLKIHKTFWEVRTSLITPGCYICHAKTGLRKAYGRNFIYCPSCSFIFTGDFPQYIARIGAGMSGSWGAADSGGEREDYLVRFLANHFKKGSFLLYGVGSTLAFPVLLSENFDVYGCDVSKSVIEYRQNEYGKTRFFHSGQLLASGQTYDVIVACEVIEHFTDPKGSIALIVKNMNADGIFCGTTNFYPGGDIEDGQKVGYMSLRNHVAYWSEKSLATVLRPYGLELITFEMVCPGSVKPDPKYHDLFPNKRVFFAAKDTGIINQLRSIKARTAILPIDLSDYEHPAYGGQAKERLHT